MIELQVNKKSDPVKGSVADDEDEEGAKCQIKKKVR
jgi:hypothetical protein